MRKAVVILLLLSHAMFLYGDESIDELLNLLQKGALKVNIVARVREKDSVSIWNMEVNRLTISGRMV
ncbi:MAG: hypothetical protein AB1798_11380, partial [Spirochaetota bacterium]